MGMVCFGDADVGLGQVHGGGGDARGGSGGDESTGGGRGNDERASV